MPNLTSVGLTAGAATSGTGTVSTLDNLIGTAGSASAQVLSVQGIASGTAQPISAASLPLPTGAATAAKQPALGTAGSASTDVITVQGIASGTAQPVTLTSTTVTGTVAVTESGTWTVQPGNTPNTSPWLASVHDGTNKAAVKAASTAPIATDPALVVALSPNSVNANGQTTMASSAPVAVASNQSWPTGMSPRGFSVAFTTNTRPANTTAYSAGDSISNNATAGSVTALTATISDTNDDPITLTEILVSSTDTGLAGKRIRAYLFNSDPTANTGVGGGDNAAYSQKVAGYIGSMSGVLETGFSDGTVGRLVPSYNDGAAASTPNAPAGGFLVTKPTSGAKTLFIQYQAIDAFTPSANSTTVIGTARGFQGRTA